MCPNFVTLNSRPPRPLPENLRRSKSRVIPQLTLKFLSSDCTLLRTKSRLQSDCSISNKIQPQFLTMIRTPTLLLEARLMLIVPPILLPRHHRLAVSPPPSPTVVVASVKRRKFGLRRDEEDTLRRRALTEAIEMVEEDTGDWNSLCQ
ncbi:Uncharacterized protein Fot_35396 [Forsythia ovata]|uniref:Uncharacterized protein n=1 Tax=Forsythia ovata TaxID=205694 RepID=A0ABD1SP84_9LAMI